MCLPLFFFFVSSSDTEMDIDDDFDRPPSMLPFVNDIVRGELCAFFVSYSSFIRETEVAVKSIHQFMPGMRIAIATHPNDYSVHERWEGETRIGREGEGGR